MIICQLNSLFFFGTFWTQQQFRPSALNEVKTRDTPPPISLSNRFQNKNSKIVSVDCKWGNFKKQVNQMQTNNLCYNSYSLFHPLINLGGNPLTPLHFSLLPTFSKRFYHGHHAPSSGVAEQGNQEGSKSKHSPNFRIHYKDQASKRFSKFKMNSSTTPPAHRDLKVALPTTPLTWVLKAPVRSLRSLENEITNSLLL